MTSRITVCLLLVVAFAGPNLPQAEGGWHEFVERSLLDWHRNNAWPQPFIQADRLATCAPFVTMRENGLTGEFTISQQHFDPASHTLTEAGQHKIVDILRRQPEGFEKVFVMRGYDEQTSAIRLDSVQQTIARFAPQGSLPEVRFTNHQPLGVPAAHIDAIGRKVEATIPDPRLPEFSSVNNN
jgi:hypothetical protein